MTNPTQPSAKVICDSVTQTGIRLTTFEIVMHRFVLAEFNTHCALSRNSASSRAIPFDKQAEKVLLDTAYPVYWGSEQKGMQSGPELSQDTINQAKSIWYGAALSAVDCASGLRKLGLYGDEKLHKSLCNRLLEPYMWHTAVVTATAYENFFIQRLSKLAQPEIEAVASAMSDARNVSEPQLLMEGEWHLPYVKGVDLKNMESVETAAYVSAARCARVSYLTQNGVRDISEDLRLWDRLTSSAPPHWSPLEHVATPWPENRQDSILGFKALDGLERVARISHLPKVGKFLEWRQLRFEIESRQGVRTFT